MLSGSWAWQSRASGAIFLTKPERTFPGPISTKRSTPWETIHRRLSSKRVGDWTWRTRSPGTVSPAPSSRGRAVALKTTRVSPMGEKGVSRNRSSRAFPAGAMRLVWKGPLTLRGRQRLAPASFARAAASATAAASPPMTTWPGQLRFATSATRPVFSRARRQQSSAAPGESPRRAVMAEGRPAAASSMARPRKAASSTAVPGSSTPAQQRAEYSPRLSPAA